LNITTDKDPTGDLMTRTRTLLGTTAALGMAALMALSTAAIADSDGFDLQSMTPDQREAFGEAVRDYLMENPQVIMEAVAVLEQRESQQQAEADVALVNSNAEALFDDGFSWVGGNPDGDVTIVEFIDYRCGYCRRAHPEVEELVASDGNIRLIVKEFPILGEASLVSSRFAVATHLVAGDEAYSKATPPRPPCAALPIPLAMTRMPSWLGWMTRKSPAASRKPALWRSACRSMARPALSWGMR
jgi:protein-disulfide isomerase